MSQIYLQTDDGFEYHGCSVQFVCVFRDGQDLSLFIEVFEAGSGLVENFSVAKTLNALVHTSLPREQTLNIQYE